MDSSEGMTRLGQIEASMLERRRGARTPSGAVQRSAEQMKKLALVLAEMTENAEAIAQTNKIVSIFDSI